MFFRGQSSSLHIHILYGLVAASALTISVAGQAPQPAIGIAANRTQLTQNYGNIPLGFETNQGQTDKSVEFLSRSGGYSL
jgi:hypothetical protein